VIAQLLGGEMVLLHIRTNQFYELNPTAARLWNLICDGRSLEQITQQLLSEYDVQPAQLNAELETMLAELKQRELVVLVADNE
jgi:hypothetical protein